MVERLAAGSPRRVLLSHESFRKLHAGQDIGTTG